VASLAYSNERDFFPQRRKDAKKELMLNFAVFAPLREKLN